MWRLGCLGVGLAVFLLWSGGQGAYTAITNWNPTRMSCQDYLRQRPDAEWLQLERCAVNLIEGSYFERNGKIEELFMPLRAAEEQESDKGQKVQMLLASKDPELLRLAQQLKDIKDQGEFLRLAVEKRDQIYAQRSVEGLVRFGVDLDKDDREKLANLDKELAPDFLILDEGKRPSFGTSLAMVGGGLVVGVLLLVGLVSQKSS
jgi:hypothetical protein